MSIFKAYDIRGIYNEEVDLGTAEAIGAAFARFLGGKTLVVGNDMRASSPEVKAAVIAGITGQGVNVIDIGLAETPMVYFAVGHLETDGGMVVTASHNPSKYTGFKMVREQSIPLSGDTGIMDIEKMVGEGVPAYDGPKGEVEEQDLSDAYVAHASKFMKPWKPFKMVVDYANGMGGYLVPKILEGHGLEVESLYAELDGTFPNHEANPLKDENIEELSRRVVESGADLGATFDGDADRCAFVDEKGVRVPSDIVTAIIARSLVPKEPGTAVVYDLRSSNVVPEEVLRLGGRPIRERVGHSFMKAVLRKEGGLFGGELSGHFYFRDNFYSDSGVIALIEVLNILTGEDRPFSAVADELRRYPSTGEINFEVEDKDGMIRRVAETYKDGEIDYLDGITVKYPGYWFNVRKSNTEPLLRLNLEATDPSLFEEKKAELLAFLGKPVSNERSGILTLLTDFGHRDPYVGVMKGVILELWPAARIVDLTHEVSPQNVLQGNFALRGAYPYFPAGTIHQVVIDPGVGSSRRILAARSRGMIFVAPDNGVLTGVLEPDDPVHSVEDRALFRDGELSRTFHGRDIFAPVAAHLGRGLAVEKVGPAVSDWMRFELAEPRALKSGAVEGEVVYVDTFGNLVTNLALAGVAGKESVRYRDRDIPILTSYAEAQPGHPLAIVDSFGFLEIAVNQGSTETHFNALIGDPVRV